MPYEVGECNHILYVMDLNGKTLCLAWLGQFFYVYTKIKSSEQHVQKFTIESNEKGSSWHFTAFCK